MTTQRNVIVAALKGHSALAEEVLHRLSRGWREVIPCAFEVRNPADLDEKSLRGADAVVVIADRHATQTATLRLFDAADQAGIPMLVLLDEPPGPANFYEFAGALAECWNADAARLCALLHGLLHRQDQIKKLRSEIALSQRFHGGLNGQITKMHEELQLAALVQREFLPREAPAMHGVEFAAMWRPTNYVSGDLYDLIRLDEDHVGVFVADAVGHGVPAALMTMVISRSLVTKEINGESARLVPPSEVLARLNIEMIRRQGRSTRFATAVYALIDCRTRTMQLAGAGHPLPVRLRADGSCQPLQTSGGLLGVFPDETYAQIDVNLEVDDRLLFYTDGFEQAFPAQADSCQRRVPSNNYRHEFAQLGCVSSAAEMIEIISRRLDDQAGSLHQVDDLTLVCVLAGPLVQAVNEESPVSLARCA